VNLIDLTERLPTRCCRSVTRRSDRRVNSLAHVWETTMDPARRTLLQVTIDDALAAEEAFSNLMGDDVEPRKEFITRYARDVRFLDI